jgi:hypothetical protein
LISCVVLLGASPLFAQTGPAGVGNATTNVLWLKADAGTSTVTSGVSVSSWSDASGNSNNAVQATSTKQPFYASVVMNGMPGLFFDNSVSANNDEMTIPDNANLDNTNGLTILTVTRPTSIDGNARAIISKRIGADDNQAYTMFYYSGNRFSVDVVGNVNRFQSTTVFTGGRDYVVSLLYDGTIATALGRSTIYVNEGLDATGSESSTSIPDYNSPVTIGTLNINDGRPFGGYISEVIVFRKALNVAERIIVHNYLFAKYGLSSTSIPATTNDIYTGDQPGNGNYDFEVAGLGTDATGSNTSVSTTAAGGLGITQVSGFENGDYLLYGHAAGGNVTQLTDVGGMTGVNNARWSRVWFVDITDASTAQTVDIGFDISDSGGGTITPVTASNYVLLYRAGQSGNWTEVTTASSIAGDVINFPGIVVPADGYYTLGSRNYMTSPLPVSLLSFTGRHTEKGVELEWSTVTEWNNDHFTIERSPDGDNFQPLLVVNGAGNSFEKQNYEVFDREPFPGRSYYRLLQTDFDGQTTNLRTIALNTTERLAFIEVIPNPSDGSFWFDLPVSVSDWAPSIINSAGQQVPFNYSTLGPRVSVDARNLPKGLYVLKLISNRGIHTAKFVIE